MKKLILTFILGFILCGLQAQQSTFVAQQQRVACEPVKLTDHIVDANHLEGLLKAFTAEHFGLNDHGLTRLSIVKKRQVWYAHFRQTYEGGLILNSELTFRVHENGNLFLYGANLFPLEQLTPDPPLDETELNSRLQKVFSGRNYHIRKKSSQRYFYVSNYGTAYSLKQLTSVG